jgi:hypothetical protein
VGLADPGWAEQGDVVVGGDELERGEVADLARVEVGLEGEVERVEAFVVGQAGEFERGAEPASFAQADLLAQEQVDELEVAHAVGLGAAK